MAYVTKLIDYSGPLTDVSPYHFYQITYWRLRGTWRQALYAWTRRDPCDATAAITPAEVIAGERQTLTLTVTLGPTPLPEKGRLAVYFPMDIGGFANRRNLACFQGPDGETGYGSRITARTARPGVELAVLVHSTGTVFTCVEVIVARGSLLAGDTLEVVIGDPSCNPPVVSEKAKTYPFRLALDVAGDGAFRPLQPNPCLRVVGSRPAYLRCFAPATPQPGRPFAIRVVAADLANHNPSHHYAGTLDLAAAGGALSGPRQARLEPGHHGSVRIEGLVLNTDQPSAIRVADEARGLMGRSNPIAPGLAPEGLALYYGEIHSHTDLSDGGGTIEDNFRWAREAEGLDFAALSDHFEDGQSYNATLEDKWRLTREITERVHEPGRFVTLLGYEIGTLASHRNVYFADGEGRMIVQGRGGEKVTMANVYQKLAGADYILIPHAPKFHGIDWNAPHDPERQRLVEICSTWGLSEEGGPLSVRHALDLGYRFGFTGGTDNHAAEPGNFDLGGLTGVYARALTREAIFEALMARRTFAMTGQRMILMFSVNGELMGSEVAAAPDQPRRLAARALASEPIASLEIIRNGETVFTLDGQGRQDVSLAWKDAVPLSGLTPERTLGGRFAYYYLRVRTVNGALGWASPVWVRPSF